MSTKPKISASHTPAIIIPATYLYQPERRRLNCESKAKIIISLPNNRLRGLYLASFFGAIDAHIVTRLNMNNKEGVFNTLPHTKNNCKMSGGWGTYESGNDNGAGLSAIGVWLVAGKVGLLCFPGAM
jgi:hypothetical protein